MKAKALHSLWKCMEELRKIEAEMPIQRASTFIYVATHPGATARQISNSLGVVMSTTNRNVRALGDQNRAGNPGYGLVLSETDDTDPRRLKFTLSPKGRRVAGTLIENLQLRGHN